MLHLFYVRKSDLFEEKKYNEKFFPTADLIFLLPNVERKKWNIHDKGEQKKKNGFVKKTKTKTKTEKTD